MELIIPENEKGDQWRRRLTPYSGSESDGQFVISPDFGGEGPIGLPDLLTGTPDDVERELLNTRPGPIYRGELLLGENLVPCFFDLSGEGANATLDPGWTEFSLVRGAIAAGFGESPSPIPEVVEASNKMTPATASLRSLKLLLTTLFRRR